MPKSIQRAYAMADVFQPSCGGDAGSNKDARWLHALIQRPIALAAHLEVHKLEFDPSPGSFTQTAYELLGLPLHIDSWARLYAMEPPDALLAHFEKQFRGSLVVGFELPPLMRHVFEQLDIPYIEFIMHPARFLDDLLFGFRCSSAEAFSAIGGERISIEQIALSAGWVQAAMSRLPRLPLKGRTAVAALQPAHERTLIRQGAFASFADYAVPFAQIMQAYDAVLVKPHLMDPHAPEAERLASIEPRCTVCNENFYYLLSHEAVEAVYSITSSACVEAPYFGKQGVHIEAYPFRFMDNPDAQDDGAAYLPIPFIFYEPDFWRTTLGAMGLTVSPYTGYLFAPKPNRARISLGMDGEYRFVDSLFSHGSVPHTTG